MNERRPIPGYPGYFASSNGRIWSTVPCRKFGGEIPLEPRELKRVIGERGYYQLMVCVNGKRLNRKVARLVLIAFCPNEDLSLVARHGRRGKLDDSIDNLEWGTSKQNQEDRKRDGTECAGTKHPMAKLTPDQVKEIRALRGKMFQSAIGKRYGINQVTVSAIQRGKIWRTI